MTKYYEAQERVTKCQPAISDGRHLVVRLVSASYLTCKDGSYTTLGSHHSGLGNCRKTSSCYISGGGRMQTPASLDANRSLECQSQHQMPDIRCRWLTFRHALWSSIIFFPCLYMVQNKARFRQSFPWYLNIVMAPTDTRARSFLSTNSCIKKSSIPSISHDCWKHSADPHIRLYLLQPWRTGFFFGDTVI